MTDQVQAAEVLAFYLNHLTGLQRDVAAGTMAVDDLRGNIKRGMRDITRPEDTAKRREFDGSQTITLRLKVKKP